MKKERGGYKKIKKMLEENKKYISKKSIPERPENR